MSVLLDQSRSIITYCCVSDWQPTFGYIEREDLEKYTFSFDAYFGNPKAMTPGVRVHFTACKEKVSRVFCTLVTEFSFWTVTLAYTILKHSV